MTSSPRWLMTLTAMRPEAWWAKARELSPWRVDQASSSLTSLLLAGAAASRQALDYDYLHRNKDCEQLIGTIDTSPYSWLDFRLQDHEKIDLFAKGVEAAVSFLFGEDSATTKKAIPAHSSGFDWEKYKKTRAEMKPTSVTPPTPANESREPW
ncbi:MAG: hypothetical protein SFX72_01755 [Isosphaeraceae bacterium]|nr:hypothetical protein [Isosphaeraceae bacterium]